jgi:NAD dependent epimerase/dehydratase family enzyme
LLPRVNYKEEIMTDEMMLSSARVEPRRLLDTGYVFHYPEMEGALRHVLGRT